MRKKYTGPFKIGVNITVQDLLRQNARIQDLNFNISEMKLSITSLYIISDAPKYEIIWTENSDVIDSFISEILKYKSWILASLHKRSWTERFTPNGHLLELSIRGSLRKK